MRGPLVRRRRALLGADAASFAVAACVGVAVAHLDGPRALLAALLAAGASVALVALLGGYRTGAGRPALRAAAARGLALGLPLAGLLGLEGAAAVPEPWLPFARAYLASALALATLASLLAVRGFERGWLASRVLLIGDGPLAREVAEGLRRERGLGLRVVGFLADGPAGSSPPGALGAPLGAVGHLEKVLREFAIERLVVTVDAAEVAAVESVLVAARLSGVVVESGVDCFEWLHERLPLEAPQRQLFLEGPGYQPSAGFEIAKRLVDVWAAVLALALTGPLIGLAAFAIRLESRGPVLFRQVRIGRGGRAFTIWKLRSMRIGAEPAGPALAEVDDPRVTRVGRLLRRSRVDELPQMWNVLRGEMSLVGPRPERPEFYDELADRYPLFRHRLAVRPGLTGWAQVQQGYVNDWDGFGVKLSYDLFYLRRRGVALDARVMWRTLWELLQLKGV